MTGTFIDTIVICTMTGLCIVLAGSWNTGLKGVQITADASEGAALFTGGFFLRADGLSGLLRIYNDPRLELLRGTVSGIPVESKPMSLS